MQRKIMPDVIRDQDLVHLGPGDTARDAAKLMQHHRVSSILVLQRGALKGIVTKRDIIGKVVAPGQDPNETTLSTIMTKSPDTIASNATAMDALRLMDDCGYRHLPVVQRGKVVAVVSRRDFGGIEKARLDDESALWERIG